MSDKAVEVTPAWYENMIGDCREVIVEKTFESNWALVEGYHAVGKRIADDKKKIAEEGVTVARMAKDLGRSHRTVQRCVQFYNKYPSLSQLPEGKDTSWHKIVNKYLPETTKEKKQKISFWLTLEEVDSIIQSFDMSGGTTTPLYHKFERRLI